MKVTDVSNDETKNGGFVVGKSYALLQDVFIRGWNYNAKLEDFKDIKEDQSFNIGLTTPRGPEVGSVPPSILAWEKNPSKYPLIYGTVKKGREFEVIRVNEVKSLEVHIIQVIVRLKGGVFDKQLLDIRQISLWSFDELKVSPDFSVIEEVKPTRIP